MTYAGKVCARTEESGGGNRCIGIGQDRVISAVYLDSSPTPTIERYPRVFWIWNGKKSKSGVASQDGPGE